METRIGRGLSCWIRSRLGVQTRLFKSPEALIGTCFAVNLMERHFEHGRSFGFQRPLTHPATIVITIDSNHLEQPVVAAKPDAVALMQAHDGW